MINHTIASLGLSPILLQDMVKQIPHERLKERRLVNKWCIHEHVCHLADAEQMIYQRFEQFMHEEVPIFEPYLPGKTTSADELIHKDMQEELEKYGEERRKLIALVESFDDILWTKKARHHEYLTYDSKILLRHTLMHDHFHMYRIEELWLTKSEFL